MKVSYSCPNTPTCTKVAGSHMMGQWQLLSGSWLEEDGRTYKGKSPLEKNLGSCSYLAVDKNLKPYPELPTSTHGSRLLLPFQSARSVRQSEKAGTRLNVVDPAAAGASSSLSEVILLRQTSVVSPATKTSQTAQGPFEYRLLRLKPTPTSFKNLARSECLGLAVPYFNLVIRCCLQRPGLQ